MNHPLNHPPDTVASGEPAALRGRPRDPERSRAILEAARDLLRSGGWDALTFEAVASKANVGRPTVYRRWPTKGHLAAEVLACDLLELGDPSQHRGIEMPDSGSFLQDLTYMLHRLVDSLRALERFGVMPGILAEMALDEELAHQVRAEVVTPNRDRVAEFVRNAIDRGEVTATCEPELLLDSLAGTVIYLMFIVHEPFGDAEIDRLARLTTGQCIDPT